LVVCLLALSQSLAAAPPSYEQIIAKTDSLVSDALKQPGAVGFSVAIARGDDVILGKGYGLAELEHKVPANESTMFRIGSITKQYTAAAIMWLVQDERLALDESITAYLADYPTQGNNITIRHLLNHTSGIRSYTSIPGFMNDRTAHEMTHDQLLDVFKNEPFDFKPGERWLYNNSGYYLLGVIIEKVVGQSYEDFLYERFFHKSGLRETRYDSSTEIIANRAQGYRIHDGKLANDQHAAMSIPGAAGGLIASARDLVKWSMLLHDRKIVRDDAYQQMIEPGTLNNGQKLDYGFGLAITQFEGKKMIAHGGGIFGFNSMLLYLPDDQVHVAVISNSEVASSEKLAMEIARAALGIEKPAVKDLALTEAQMKPYLGNYKFQAIPLELRVFIEDGKLMSQATNQPKIRLLPQGEHEFRADFDHDVKLVFTLENDQATSFMLHQGGAQLIATRKD
jgi:CubicO group peptidase (beta-lactamase class C family)